MRGVHLPTRQRGLELLIVHCAALDLEPRRGPARRRVEAELGGDLAGRLVASLTGGGRSGGYGSRPERAERRGRRMSSCP